MKRLPTLLSTAFAALFATGQLSAADPQSSFGLAPSAPPPAPAETTSDSPLIPEIAPTKPLTREEAKAAAYKGMNKTEVSEDKLRQRIQWRAATAKAERDPGLQAIKAKALAARTDYEQRQIFIDYYTKFFDLVAKIDPKLPKAEIDTKKAMYTARFTQGRVAPTIDPAVARAARN